MPCLVNFQIPYRLRQFICQNKLSIIYPLETLPKKCIPLYIEPSASYSDAGLLCGAVLRSITLFEKLVAAKIWRHVYLQTQPGSQRPASRPTMLQCSVLCSACLLCHNLADCFFTLATAQQPDGRCFPLQTRSRWPPSLPRYWRHPLKAFPWSNLDRHCSCCFRG